jgi:hypothetical protein
MIKPGRQIDILTWWDMLKKLHKIKIYNETTTPLLKNIENSVHLIINIYYKKHIKNEW